MLNTTWTPPPAGTLPLTTGQHRPPGTHHHTDATTCAGIPPSITTFTVVENPAGILSVAGILPPALGLTTHHLDPLPMLGFHHPFETHQLLEHHCDSIVCMDSIFHRDHTIVWTPDPIICAEILQPIETAETPGDHCLLVVKCVLEPHPLLGPHQLLELHWDPIIC